MSDFAAKMTLNTSGLSGALTPVVVRSGFGAGIWVSVLAENLDTIRNVINPLRTFSFGHSSIRFGDLQTSCSENSMTGDKIGLLVFLGVNDSSVVLMASLDSAEPSNTGTTLVRARLVEPFQTLSFGSEGHYSSAPLDRLAGTSGLCGIINLNSTVPAQMAEQLWRLAALIKPGQHPLYLLQASVLAAVLTTDLDGAGCKISCYKGPIREGSTEDELGCAARILPLLWVANRLGYLDVFKGLCQATTKEGSSLLERLETITSKSPDSWAKELRRLRKQEYLGEPLRLPVLAEALKTSVPAFFLHHAGLVVCDIYTSLCQWLKDSEQMGYLPSLDLVSTFTTADASKGPIEEASWTYLGLPLKMAMRTDSSSGVLALSNVMAPRKHFLDMELYNQVFGAAYPVTPQFESLFRPASAGSTSSDSVL